MAKGYWIVNVDVTDPDQYAKYQAFVRPFLADNSGTFFVRGGRHEVVEGTSRSRQVVIEFPSYEQALAAYRSPEYQDGMKLRAAASAANFVIAEGLEAP
jgi:uncharacterized protein (DUF1330 family)